MIYVINVMNAYERSGTSLFIMLIMSKRILLLDSMPSAADSDAATFRWRTRLHRARLQKFHIPSTFGALCGATLAA